MINKNTNNPEFFNNEQNISKSSFIDNEFDKFIDIDFDYIYRMKNEANTFFAISNFNKSIELNSTIIKLIENKKKLFIDLIKKNNLEKSRSSTKFNVGTLVKEFDFAKSKTCDIITNCFNNRGNSYLKNNNFQEAIADFNTVLLRDEKNVKAYFRRGMAYYSLQIFNQALNNFKQALNLANETERLSIQAQLDKTLIEINSLIKSHKNKSEKFEIGEQSSFRKAVINDIDEDLHNQIKQKFESKSSQNDNLPTEELKQKEGSLLIYYFLF